MAACLFLYSYTLYHRPYHNDFYSQTWILPIGVIGDFILVSEISDIKFTGSWFLDFNLWPNFT